MDMTPPNCNDIESHNDAKNPTPSRMKNLLPLLSGILLISQILPSTGQNRPQNISEVLSDHTLDLKRPLDRARAVERIQAIENDGMMRARAKARSMGIPIRQVLADGSVSEIMGLDENGEFLIYTTHNANAAISSAANLVYPAPYDLDGTGITVGVWDESAVRVTHTEFQTGSGSRVTVRDGATTLSSHATHVAGTVAARGASASRKGMAPNAFVDSYNWTSDTSEMIAAGASMPQETGKINISNHSYGFSTGWRWNGSNWQWLGTGTDQNGYARQFGQYTTQARDWDNIAYNAPYYLIFKSAGNDNSNNPSAGSQVIIGGNTVTYDPAIHPPGNGLYRNATNNPSNGYENISHGGNAKNIMTIGAANDAVTSGMRDPAKSTLTSFSSRGPTDDGRIKPDIVANGASLSSTESSGDNAYGSKSGTSMSSPSAAGSAALLVQLYRNLFPGDDMRASTLKGLIIHTATDIGNPGPDYHYGWGLMDTKKAADLIIDHHDNPSKNLIIEDQLNNSFSSKTYTFNWDGVSPVRATLCWTDPAGAATSTHDLRSSRLVNDLDLRIIAPDGTQHYPFVMPFVGTWTVASMSAHATTGDNTTDNVEQVLIQNPAQSGTWTVIVDHKGGLTNNQQTYSLIFSGIANSGVPLALNSIAPNTGDTGSIVTVDITGTSLSEDTEMLLRKSGRPDITATSVEMVTSNTLRCVFDLTGAVSAAWDLVATNPNQESTTLAEAFTVSPMPLWSESFDGPISGWTNVVDAGPHQWVVTQTRSHTPDSSYFAANEAFKVTSHLISPSIPIPADATDLEMRFWHWYDLETGFDGGRLEFSIDGGAWFGIEDPDSGAEFTENGYTHTISASHGNDIGGKLAWSGNSGAFVRTVVDLQDEQKFAGKSLRMRWTIATDTSVAALGWYVDSVSLLSNFSEPSTPPVITEAATTGSDETVVDGGISYEIIRDSGVNLTVAATDDAGEVFLTYTWSADGPAPVTYSMNGNNAAKSTAATFEAAGDYAITVTVQNPGGLSATSSVNVRVLETTELAVAPESALIVVGQSQPFSATLVDQFGAPVATQPSTISWSTDGGGSISSAGLFQASEIGGPFTITAIANGDTGIAEITVEPIAAGIEIENLAQIYDDTPREVTVTTSPPGLAFTVTYDGSANAPVDAGSYAVTATITEPNHSGIASGTLVVAKAGQVITFAPLDHVGADDAPFALTAIASSGLPVSFTSSNPSVASISGNLVTPQAVGTTTITATQAGNVNYEAASVSQPLNVVAEGQIAIGGEVTYLDGHYIHTFTQGGTFELLGAGEINVEVLVVGGGGGGGSSTVFGTAGAGGGGAGGLVYREGFLVTGPQDVVIGAAGAAAGNGNTPGSNGGNSAFGPLVALGGGGGSGGNMQGLAGGSGGGSRGNSNGGAGQQPGTPSGGFGNAGGGWPSASGDGAGGGGGAGEAAPSSPPQDPKAGGPGGTGRAYDISGALVYYAGGGGGGGSTTSAFGLGGNGGGGNGGNNGTPPTAGTPHTGGGGGGGNNNRVGASGGAGIVIIRYPGIQITPYQAWTITHNLNENDALPETILQADGLTNLEKFAFGMDPNVANFAPLGFTVGGDLTTPGAPTLHNFAPPGQPDDERAVFARRKDHAEVGLIYTVHFSADLKQWTATTAEPVAHTGGGDEGDHEVVSVPFTESVPVEGGAAPQPARFMRVTVSME